MKRPSTSDVINALGELQVIVSCRSDKLTPSQLDALETIYWWMTIPPTTLDVYDVLRKHDTGPKSASRWVYIVAPAVVKHFFDLVGIAEDKPTGDKQ